MRRHTATILEVDALKDMFDQIIKSIEGHEGHEQQRIADFGVQFLHALLSKTADYGATVWRVPVLAPGCDIETALMVRMSDKVDRISSLLADSDASLDGKDLDDVVAELGELCLLYLARPDTIPNTKAVYRPRLEVAEVAEVIESHQVEEPVPPAQPSPEPAAPLVAVLTEAQPKPIPRKRADGEVRCREISPAVEGYTVSQCKFVIGHEGTHSTFGDQVWPESGACKIAGCEREAGHDGDHRSREKGWYQATYDSPGCI